MNVGMLGFDNDAKSELATRVSRAADYYSNKYGKHPNLCFAHPSIVDEPPSSKADQKAINLGEIEVRLTKSVLPNHLWIGIDSQDGKAVS